MDNIGVLSPGTSEELITILTMLNDYLEKPQNNLPIRVIVIDSMTFPMSDIEDSWEKTTGYLKMLKRLQIVASRHNITVIIVNEQMTQIDRSGEMYFYSAGGQPVATRSHKRLLLARIRGPKFAARLIKSPTMPQLIVPFCITSVGVRDTILEK